MNQAEQSQEGPISRAYAAALGRRGYSADASQLEAVARFDRLALEFAAFKAQRNNALKRFFSRPEVPRGVWLWGGVGRGKSFVMDLFFDEVSVRRKRRTHFHEFMREIHHELEALKGQQDPLDSVAEKVAKQTRLLCFDEFHISDIADAMILERLLRGFFKHGVCLVATSNYEPDRLYPDGLHRDRILPAIDLLKANMDVINVDAGNDYRRRSLTKAQIYFSTLGAETDRALRKHFESLAERADETSVLTIERRQLKALRRAGGVVWFDFNTLCGGPRSQNDYLELAQRFHTLILSNVPLMSAAQSSEARRFTWLIDILYDQKVKLVVSAEGQPEQLYTQGTLANEFQRTVSRMIEMQSEQYLMAPRRSVE